MVECSSSVKAEQSFNNDTYQKFEDEYKKWLFGPNPQSVPMPKSNDYQLRESNSNAANYIDFPIYHYAGGDIVIVPYADWSQTQAGMNPGADNYANTNNDTFARLGFKRTGNSMIRWRPNVTVHKAVEPSRMYEDVDLAPIAPRVEPIEEEPVDATTFEEKFFNPDGTTYAPNAIEKGERYDHGYNPGDYFYEDPLFNNRMLEEDSRNKRRRNDMSKYLFGFDKIGMKRHGGLINKRKI